MKLASLQSPLHLLLCYLFVQRVVPHALALLSVRIVLAVTLYIWSFLLLVFPFNVFIYQRLLSPLRHIPTVPTELNHWKTWLAAEPSPPQLLEWVKVVKERPGFQGLMRYRGIGGGERILICGPKAMREVLVAQQYSHFDRPLIARKRIAVQAGTGLIASGGDVHKAQKRMLLPAFGPRAVKDLYPLFWRKGQELVSALREHVQVPKQSVVEITSWTSRSALDIIGVAAWGKDFDAITHPESAFLKSYGGMFDISGGGQFVNALALAVPMKYAMQIPCAYNRRLKDALQTVRVRCEAAVRERLEVKDDDSRDILSLLIKGGVRDEDALVNQMMTILAAGHDTSSVSLAWACYVLGRHQDVQRRLREEVLASDLPIRPEDDAGKSDEPTGKGLEYLHAVANEILRLYPSVPVTRREALRDGSVQGYFIPEGSHMVSSGWVINRMPEEWGPDALEFKPERWMKSEDMDNFAFASFSHGPRSCIGQGFARAEFLVFLAALVGNFQIDMRHPEKEVPALYGITMSPAGGVEVRLRAIES
ncbi:cytochrome P450 [Lecanosticta acicola]|uniref:Cytochrome P450 n=1 Tax=Lecanosticta acicola TaxID=111012 RepID=A0AAI8Z8L0_9PEZI|nr:cytochrome P450 [Lecanosticta acicola]